MTFNPYDYSSPYPEQQPNFPGIPQAPVAGQPPWTLPMQRVTGGPMAGLGDEVASVLNAADSHHIYLPGPGGSMLTYPRGRGPSVARDMILGAAAGFGAWVVWRKMRARKARVGTWTTPTFRATAIWWLLFAVTVAAQSIWRNWLVLIAGFVVSSVLASWYLVRNQTPRRAEGLRLKP